MGVARRTQEKPVPVALDGPWYQRCCARKQLFTPGIQLKTPAAATDLVSPPKALPDCRMGRGIRFPKWWMRLVERQDKHDEPDEGGGSAPMASESTCQQAKAPKSNQVTLLIDARGVPSDSRHPTDHLLLN
jgi:hypothetical protein